MDSETLYIASQIQGTPYGYINYSNFSSPVSTWTSVTSSSTGTGNYGVTYSSGSLTFNVPGIYIITAQLNVVPGTSGVNSVGFSINGGFSNSNICQSAYQLSGSYSSISGSVCQGYSAGSVIHLYAWTIAAETIQCSLSAAFLSGG
jgi:hypothetical protein